MNKRETKRNIMFWNYQSRGNPDDNGNRRATTQAVTKYVDTKLMSNYWGFSGSDGPLVFVSEITFWDSMESKDLDWYSIESKGL